MSSMLQPGIILLQEGTDTSQGIPQLIGNINACEGVVEMVRTTLGPRGMDKLIYGDEVAISNDGATIMKLLDVVHPAARTLVEIAKSQDAEVGDGTTSVVVLAGEFLKGSKVLIDEGMHQRLIIQGFRKACQLAKEMIEELSVSVDMADGAQYRSLMEKCAMTSMSSKLIADQSQFFSKMVVDAVEVLDDPLDLSMIGIKKENGGSLLDSVFVHGVAFKKTFSYAGFEQAPKCIRDPRICLLNVELELRKERDNAEVQIKDPLDYQRFVDAEWNIIYGKLSSIVESGANVVLSRLAIGDLATQYFADRGIFCAGRVLEEDLKRVAKATGANISTSTNKLENQLGSCGLFEERQVGSNRYNFFVECPKSKSATIILRGGGEQFIEETERSIHDAIMIVKRTRKYNKIVAGGGAIEMELSKMLYEYARKIPGKQQMVISLFSKALEVIPRQLTDNAGLDSTDILNQLRKAHAEGQKWVGVNLASDAKCHIINTFENCVWEPNLVKINSIEAATEAACLILSIDETVKNPKADSSVNPPGGGGGRMVPH